MADGGGRQRRAPRARRVLAAGAATVTATALTAGFTAPPPAPVDPVVTAGIAPLAAVQLLPPPGALPDLTFGLGAGVFDLQQRLAEPVLRVLVEGFDLGVLARALGVDPVAVLERLLDSVTVSMLVTELLGDVLDGLGGLLELPPLVSGLIDALVRRYVEDRLDRISIVDLLELAGLGLADLLDFGRLDIPGLNVVTSGTPFALAELVGFDVGWHPALPRAIATAVEDSGYLGVGTGGLLLQLIGEDSVIGRIVAELADRFGLDMFDLRAVTVFGYGMGAFAAGAAYRQVVADLAEQPGGSRYPNLDPLLGSLTVLPMLLLANPGQPNGGILARLYPLGDLVGIPTVTPATSAHSDGSGLPLPDTGLTAGAANLLPVLVDIATMYDPMADFAAWANPFTIANNLAAALFPTYLLRGTGVLDTLLDFAGQLGPQVGDIVGDLFAGPLSANLYLTVRAGTLPLLEPLYLATDFINLFTPGFDFSNPLATALSPLLTSLVNLGYTDVYWNPRLGIYDRTLDEAGVPTAFGALPAINWLEVPVNLLGSLLRGIADAITEGLVTFSPRANPLDALLRVLGVGGAAANASAASGVAASDDGDAAGVDESDAPNPPGAPAIGPDVVDGDEDGPRVPAEPRSRVGEAPAAPADTDVVGDAPLREPDADDPDADDDDHPRSRWDGPGERGRLAGKAAGKSAASHAGARGPRDAPATGADDRGAPAADAA